MALYVAISRMGTERGSGNLARFEWFNFHLDPFFEESWNFETAGQQPVIQLKQSTIFFIILSNGVPHTSGVKMKILLPRTLLDFIPNHLSLQYLM